MIVKLNYHQRTQLALVNESNAPVQPTKAVSSGTYVHIIRSAGRDVYLLPYETGPARFVRTI